jgi:hypothetical protein
MHTLNAAGNTVLSWHGRLRMTSIVDGTSHTLLYGEKHKRPNTARGTNEDRCIFGGVDNAVRRGAGIDPSKNTNIRPLAQQWYKVGSDYTGVPATALVPTTWFGGPHPNFCQFVLCDGSVRPISVDINVALLGNLAARNDGLPSGGEY